MTGVEDAECNCGLLVVHMALQAFITIILLGFAYLVRSEDPSMSSVVVGATILHWLKESTYSGRQIAAGRHTDTITGSDLTVRTTTTGG